MPNRYISLTWGDLTSETQESLIETIKESLTESYKAEGEAQMQSKWHVAPKSWQEAFIRTNCIRSHMWSDLSETSEEFQTYDWKYEVEEYTQEQAESKLAHSIKLYCSEVEITL